MRELDGACPHVGAVRVETGGWTYDPELDLWVHGREDCRRPSRPVLRGITGLFAGRRPQHLPPGTPPREPRLDPAS